MTAIRARAVREALAAIDILGVLLLGRVEAITTRPCAGCGTTHRPRYSYGLLSHQVACSRRCAREAGR